MFIFFKKKKCKCCGKKTFKGIEYAGIKICSESCMVEYFKNLTTEQLMELEIIDRLIYRNF